MKIWKKAAFLVILTLAFMAALLSAPNAYAAAPTLSLSSASDGDSVQLTVTGAADASVVFYYTKIGTGLQMNYLGKTNSSGNFTTSLSTSAYSISGDTVVYVTVNGLKSNEEAWPYLSAASVLSLSQTSVILPLSQTSSLTVYNNGTNFVYLSSNSNPPVVNVNIEGNKVNLKALNFGSTVVTVCAGTGTPSCASAYVTVQNTGGTALAFSQNNPTVAANKKITVNIIGGTGAYILLNNVNASAIQASLSASTLTLSTTAASGSSAITICSSDMSSCGIINAIVGNVSSVGLTFGIVDPTMTIGQNLSVPISGGTGGSYSVFSNSDTDVVTASVSDTALILVAKEGGVATVIVCSSMGNCAPEVITVSYNTTTGGSLKLSQNNLWLLVGQASSITVTGGAMPYSAVGYSESVLKASFTNNILTITGVGGGSATVNVCSNGGCVGLAVLVSGSSSSETSSILSLSQTSLALKAGASVTVSISGNGNYFVAYNTNSTVATAAINGSSVAVNALVAGATDVSICQNGGQCAVLKIAVSGDAAALALSQTSLVLRVGNTGKILISGAGGYSVSSNTDSSIASAAISGGTVTISALSVGSTNISICQSVGQCAAITVAVAAAEQVAGEKITNQGADWTFCSNEKQTCQFTGYQTVRYGANGKYVYGSYLNGVGCTNSVLGDPIENVVKQCYYGGVIPSGADAAGSVAGDSDTNAADWTNCAAEKQVCKFSGLKTVRYGANGKYYYGIYSGSISCLNSVFGDPVENTVKQCSYGGVIPANAPTAVYKFKNVLVYGSSGNEVKELQKKLVAAGLFTEAIDGKYLTSTVAAVKKYQQSKGIKQTGNVGVLTIAALNK
ncbi:MAG: peptidoglycan-binding domain-containing protein [Patescibacteria group bacterium]|nr:peptidoglycan-binding domain-containing protein [Patescibacteria group bacterium]